MFYKEDQQACECKKTNNQRYKEDGITPVATTTQLPLSKQIATYFNNKKDRDNLLYRVKREADNRTGNYEDISDGAIYRKYKHLFKNDHDLALALYIDGFNPQKRGATSMVTFMAVILNLPPDIR